MLSSGNYAEALMHYEKGIEQIGPNAPDLTDHTKVCQSGIARTCIKNGNYQKGVRFIPLVPKYRKCLNLSAFTLDSNCHATDG